MLKMTNPERYTVIKNSRITKKLTSQQTEQDGSSSVSPVPLLNSTTAQHIMTEMSVSGRQNSLERLF